MSPRSPTRVPMSQSDLMAKPDFEGVQPLHTTEDFHLYIGPWPTPMWEGQEGYHIINTRTGVCEGVIGTEAMALSEMQTQQSHLNQVLGGGGAVTTDDDAAFQEMMHRLSSKE